MNPITWLNCVGIAVTARPDGRFEVSGFDDRLTAGELLDLWFRMLICRSERP